MPCVAGGTQQHTSAGGAVVANNKTNILKLFFVVLRKCTVAVKDVQDVEHSVEVTAETLYEAVAAAVAALQKDDWVGEIGQGFTTITVLVHQPPNSKKDSMRILGRL